MPDLQNRTAERTERSLSLTTAGLTLFGVLLGIGTTVGFGVNGSWSVKLLCGAVTTVALVAVVKAATWRGRGPAVRLANWILSAPQTERR